VGGGAGGAGVGNVPLQDSFSKFIAQTNRKYKSSNLKLKKKFKHGPVQRELPVLEAK
jgi:hypothetical protein